MAGWFKGTTGEWYSGAERSMMAQKTKKARRAGVPEVQIKSLCSRCGQTQGYVAGHNNDYEHPWKHWVEVCGVCHAVIHAETHAPKGCLNYWLKVKNGHMPQPVGTMYEAFKVVNRVYGIYNRKILPPESVQRLYNRDGFRNDRWAMFDRAEADIIHFKNTLKKQATFNI